MGWMRITKWKVMLIALVIVCAVIIDGYGYISRLTQTRESAIAATPAATTTQFTVAPGTGAAFLSGESISIGSQSGTVKSISGDTITLTKPLSNVPAAGAAVKQSPSLFASLFHPITSQPQLFGAPIFIHRGLDIQGGTQLVIEICHGFNNPPDSNCRNGPPPGVTLSDARDATLPVLRQRVNSLGVSESTVQTQGEDQILVSIPGASAADAQKTVGTTAKLHFATAVPDPPGFQIQELLAVGNNPNCAPDSQTPLCQWIHDQENLYDPAQLSDQALYQTGYHWKIDDKLPASGVTNADVGTDTQTGQSVVQISFDSSAASEWSAITTAAYNQYITNPSAPQAHIAIFLDNDIISAPVVTGGNQSSQTEISNIGSLQQVQQLATEIRSGALPAEITTVQVTEVPPSLGQQTVRQTLIAGAVGLLIVILFMVGYYRFPGLLASLALLSYAAINLALYKAIGVTVSLAGLAGFVLSVGMAVDANVLIFERTRDELRHGRSVGLAVETGFRRAFPAIRDSNFSTLIACFVLWEFGSDVVKGFAATLGIGVVVSFLSAIWVTQSLLAWVLRWRIGRHPTLYTEIHDEYVENPPKGRFDIVKSRNLYFLASLLIIVPGILSILAWHDTTSPNGFRLGLDFSGGETLEARFNNQTSTQNIISVINQFNNKLQPLVDAEGNNKFLIRVLPIDPGTEQNLVNTLDSNFHFATRPNGQPDITVNSVGPTVAADLVRSAVILVLISAVLIAAYLAFQFRRQKAISPWRFSVCTFLKLLHDVFVLLGIWAILGHFTPLGQVDSLFITALLTSVAFSIHDTIVVFDRIRENLRVGPRLTFDQTINLSTVQTMTRSLNTSLTVVFVLSALVLFGGVTIRGFVLALLIGIVTGTYSSIFNASTLLVAWQKARPQDSGRGPRRVTRAAA